MSVKAISNLALAFLVLFVYCGCGQRADTKVDPEAIVFGCANHLRRIEAAKKTWAQQKGAGQKETPTWDDLNYLFRNGPPTCPGGGTYTIGSMSELPECSIAAHNEYFKSNMAPEAPDAK